MKNIKTSPYYFSIYPTESSSFYGLLNSLQNRFYILHKDPFLIKFLQMILLRQYELFTLVDFKNFDFSSHPNIDNDTCHEWGGSHLMTKILQIDADSYFTPSYLTKAPTYSDFDVGLQNKIFCLMATINKIQETHKLLKNTLRSNINSQVDSLRHTKKIFKLLMPTDTVSIDFTEKEENQLLSILKRKTELLEESWDCTIKELLNLELVSIDSVEILKHKIAEILQKDESKFLNMLTVFQHQRPIFLKLLDFLGISQEKATLYVPKKKVIW